MFVCSECGNGQPSAGYCSVDGTPLAAIGEDLLLGTTIGVYRVARLMGIGGMGRVYKGVHPTIGSRVAIKVLSRECSDRKDLVDRFFAEARAVNLIRHESIVNVLDLAMLPDGRPYIIMEYLDGAPLASVVDAAIAHGPPLPLGGLARLAAEVLDALGAAHAKGIIHRDLKPDNVYVTPNGRAKVLDFGIAKLDDQLGTTRATRTGSLLGTPHYMAPEQAAGRPVDHRADLYAMGVILFECATGQKPFQADSLFDLLRKHVEAPPPSPRALRGDLPPDFEQVILVALAKVPDQRWATAEAMSVALQHATTHLAPDQWAPLSGAGVRHSSTGWSPTPPASWAKSGGGAPPPPGTVSSGQQIAQAAAPAKPKSKTALFAVLGLLLVGGGVTAGVLATRGSTGNPGSIVAAGAGSTSANAGTAAADTTAGSAPPTIPAPPTVIAPADDEDDSDEDDEAPAPDADGKTAEERALDLIKHLPPEQQLELAPLIDLAKLPRAERAARIAQITDKLGKLGVVVPKAPVKAPPAPPVESTPDEDEEEATTAQPPKGPPPWLTWHDLKGFAVSANLDVAAFIKFARAEARKAVPDATMYRYGFDNVRKDGTAAGPLEMRLFSPSRKATTACDLRVEVEQGKAFIRPIEGSDCEKTEAMPVPTCTMKQLWAKAIEKKPEIASTTLLAEISYYGRKGTGYWYFSIKADAFAKPLISERFDDDC